MKSGMPKIERKSARPVITVKDAPSSRKSLFFAGTRFEIELAELKGTRIAPLSAHAFQVIIVLQGACRFRIEEEKGSVDRSHWLLANPGESFILDAAESRLPPCGIVKITIDCRKLYDLARDLRVTAHGNELHFKSRLAAAGSLDALGQTIETEMRERRPGKTLMLSSVVDQLAVHLVRHFVSASYSAQLELSRVGPVDRRIRRAVELMHLRYNEELSLRVLAGEAYLSPYHFSRLFKRLMGMAPHAYLAAIRVERAKELLANHDLAIVNVGERVGYENHSHFTKVFRSAVGVTPKVFRDSLVS